ncbi:hypothetical protein P879_10105 [Paragonimus westermani]|uniref:HTH La-type RNA-binding domain-containing protein n=1 Tax=Paragonimus westermani TaxID=34504 RepID=A0A8T0DDA2_9TREM|nr:hypothetical protein P879_10105 [Paragonimus westermani]
MDEPPNATVEENDMRLVDCCQQDKENFCNAAVDDATLKLIRQQCEFYFSDNSTDGWVELEIIEKFKKMQKWTQSHAVVVQALSRSSTLELSEDGN